MLDPHAKFFKCLHGVSPVGRCAQVMEGKEWKDVDWKRHALFCSFGFFYLVSWIPSTTEHAVLPGSIPRMQPHAHAELLGAMHSAACRRLADRAKLVGAMHATASACRLHLHSCCLGPRMQHAAFC